MNKKPRVSIVIPVYNEEERLSACLQAIAAQTVRPFEVIVVDNNSTDQTVAVAHRYPFVKVLRESRQGVVFARDRGFDAVRGDIIGRIDGDSIIDPDWVASVQGIFGDGTVSAATGKVRYYDMALDSTVNTIDLWARRYMAYRLGREVALQGANMAVRRTAWRRIRKNLCHTAGIHEDFDVAVHANELGGLVIFDESMVATIGYRLAETSYREFIDYAYTSPRTYAYHGLKSGRKMYPIVGLVILCYLPLRWLRHGYDSRTDKFSWRLAFTAVAERRVNPATFGDY